MESMNMNIKVDNYQIKVSNSFNEFRANEEFCDVTLACDDDDQIEAHKVILSASSSFFRNILRKNKHSHPFLYLRGISKTDLLNVIDFIYFGEASIAQDDFKRFMSIAEDLKLVGLSENVSLSESDFTSPVDESNLSLEADLNEPELKEISCPKNASEKKYDILDVEPKNENYLNSGQMTTIQNALDKYLEDELNKDVSKDTNRNINYKDLITKDGKKFICNNCGKVSTDRSNLRKHVRKHITVSKIEIYQNLYLLIYNFRR